MRDAKIRKQESGSSAYEYKSTMNNSKQTRRMKTPKKNTKESWVFNIQVTFWYKKQYVNKNVNI